MGSKKSGSKKEITKGTVVKIKSAVQYEECKNNGLVVVDFNTVWCSPCKKFAPKFEEFANRYPEIVFLSVDADKIDHEDCSNLSSVPTFRIFFNGLLKREFSGVDPERLNRYIDRYSIQIFFNGHIQRNFSQEDKERIIDYMNKFTIEEKEVEEVEVEVEEVEVEVEI